MRDWIWLSSKYNVKIQTALRLLSHFETPENIHNATVSEMEKIVPLTPKERELLGDKSYAEADGILQRCMELSISLVTLGDELYPDRLRNIPDPPLTLYYRGTFPRFDDEVTISMVGTRKCSAYGMLCAKRLGGQIAACGGLVISGAAMGIDGMSMEGALLAGSRAIGVVGGGVDVIYPRGNRSLLENIAKYGCLISEYPPGTRPEGWRFPRRNRILSGLALGVLVVEAPEKSGALITAAHALEHGRDVFAVPGNIGVSSTEGSNLLIKEGAVVVSNGWDVMEQYYHLYPEKIQRAVLGPELLEALSMTESTLPEVAQPKTVPTAPPAPKNTVDQISQKDAIDIAPLLEKATPAEQEILKLLAKNPMSTADLIDQCQTNAAKVLSTLTMLQVKGYVKKYPGSHVALASKL